MSLSELGRYNEALSGLEKGFSRSNDPEIRRMCGLQLLRVYTGLKRDNKAVEVALQLNRLYADDPEVLYQSGKIYGNFAYQTMHKLWHVDPDSIWRHQAAAEAYESQTAFDQALIQYQAVLQAGPAPFGNSLPDW
jgi:tetratricopeptide (TPR) repeat protein